MENISAENVVWFLGAGLISVLTTIAVFTFRDLYRRLQKLEKFRDESDVKISNLESETKIR